MGNGRSRGRPQLNGSFLSKEAITNLLAIGGVLLALAGFYFSTNNTLTLHTQQIEKATSKQETIENKVNDIDKNVAVIQQKQDQTHDTLAHIVDRLQSLTPAIPVNTGRK